MKTRTVKLISTMPENYGEVLSSFEEEYDEILEEEIKAKRMQEKQYLIFPQPEVTDPFPLLIPLILVLIVGLLLLI